MAVLGVPRPPSFCSQGEKLCEITLALTPLKKFTPLKGYLLCLGGIFFYFKSFKLSVYVRLEHGVSQTSWDILGYSVTFEGNTGHS